MLLCSMQEDDYVIQIDKAIYPIQLSQAILHQLLKSSWSVAHPKGYAVTFGKA